METEQKRLEQTVQCFLAAIEAQSQEEIQALTDSVAAEKQERERLVRQTAQAEGENVRQSGLSQVENAGMLTVAARRAENRRTLLAYRQQCQAQAVQAVLEKLRVYTKGSDYAGRLAALLEQGLAALRPGQKPVVVYLRREDMNQAEALRKKAKAVSLTVKEGDFALGGLLVAVPEAGRRVDLTFDTSLRQVQEQFGEIAGWEIS
jgi:vacuolar-type H+-ATPase subunit E/Vma4